MVQRSRKGLPLVPPFLPFPPAPINSSPICSAVVRISVSSDMATPTARTLVDDLRRRGHEVAAHGALAGDERDDWAWASERAARDVAEGRADQAIVCCWTGTGASIAANKVRGIRAALCGDAETARGARAWNDANVLALSLRSTSEPVAGEILDAWFASEPSADAADRANVDHISEIETPT
jgi:ribose 5-phosphate isomerase B